MWACTENKPEPYDSSVTQVRWLLVVKNLFKQCVSMYRTVTTNKVGSVGTYS